MAWLWVGVQSQKYNNLVLLTYFAPSGVFVLADIDTFWAQKLDKKNC